MHKALTILRLIERTFLVVVFLVMVALYFLNVVVRASGSGIASQVAWIEEGVRTLNLYLVFLALGLALETGRHVAVDTWRDGLARRLRLPLRPLIDLTGLVFSSYFAWLSWKLAAFVQASGQTSPTLGIGSYWIYVAPMLGFGLLALRFALSLGGVIDRFGDHQPAGDA